MTITTDAEAIQYLASMQCKTCYGDELLMQNGEGDKPCLDCRRDGHPTGRRFTGLTKKCWYCHGIGYRDTSDLQWSNDVGCSECGGAGRRDDGNMVKGSGLVPIPVADAVLYLMGQPEFRELSAGPLNPLDYRAHWATSKHYYVGDAPTIIQALARAIAAAEE